MDIYKVLTKKFGYQTFREGQEEIIRDVLANKDVMAILPTGTGKSLCYQLPAYLLDGLVVVVSPLLALMEDQVEQLKKMGEKRVVAYNSFLSESEKRHVITNLASYKLLYISPESLQAFDVLNAIKRVKVSLFVIDEAHCISQWGHEFRTDYLKLAYIRKMIGMPRCLAVTATATTEVQQDIMDQLKLINPVIHNNSMDRPNIALTVKHIDNPMDKYQEILTCIKEWRGPGIIYTSSRNAAESIAEFLRQNGIVKAAYYHGGMEMEERLLIQRQFIEDQLSVICCTSAFGMGVNKSNVRYVIHYHMPGDLGSYLQEIGRAGRDQNPSMARLLYSEGDEDIQFSLIDQEFPSFEDVERFFQVITDQGVSSYRDYEAIGNGLGINEIALSFLIYQIENKTISNPKALVDEIWGLIEKRKKYKWNKLYNMLQFVNEAACRRKFLLKEFNEVLKESIPNCCDNCGIDESIYTGQTDEEILQESFNWLTELKVIFDKV